MKMPTNAHSRTHRLHNNLPGNHSLSFATRKSKAKCISPQLAQCSNSLSAPISNFKIEKLQTELLEKTNPSTRIDGNQIECQN